MISDNYISNVLKSSPVSPLCSLYQQAHVVVFTGSHHAQAGFLFFKARETRLDWIILFGQQSRVGGQRNTEAVRDQCDNYYKFSFCKKTAGTLSCAVTKGSEAGIAYKVFIPEKSVWIKRSRIFTSTIFVEVQLTIWHKHLDSASQLFPA